MERRKLYRRVTRFRFIRARFAAVVEVSSVAVFNSFHCHRVTLASDSPRANVCLEHLLLRLTFSRFFRYKERDGFDVASRLLVPKKTHTAVRIL